METLELRKARKNSFRFVGLVLTLIVLSCAGAKTHFIHLRPHPEGKLEPKTDLTIAVVPFEDQRDSPNVLGQRVLSGGDKEAILLESPSVSEDVTYIMRRAIKARGMRVVELYQWDPVPANLESLQQEVDVVVAGRIVTLEVEAQSSTLKTTVRYQVKLSAKLGFRKQRKVVTKSVEVSPEVTAVRFKIEKVEEGLNEALASAVNSLLETILSSSDHL